MPFSLFVLTAYQNGGGGGGGGVGGGGGGWGGLTERIPRDDLSGHDVRYKSCLCARVKVDGNWEDRGRPC